MKTYPVPLLSFALALASELWTVPAAETFTPHHVARLRAVTATVVSPDGTEVAYLLAVPRKPMTDDDGPAFAELHIVNAQGQSRPFISGKVNIGDIAWTPDGQAISYVAKRDKDEHRSLYVIPRAGGESRKVVVHEADISGYAWSSDGKRVALLASEPESKEKKERTKKGFNQQVYEEDLVPTRVWVAEVDPDAEPPKKPRKLDLPGSASDVKWSPAGPFLGVALAPTPSVDDGMMRRVVHLVGADSGRVTTKLDHSAKLGTFDWSPDGRHLFTISGEDMHDPREGRLFLWTADGGRPRDLLPDYRGHVAAVAWKDNYTLSVVGGGGVWTALHEVKLDGSKTTRLKTGGPTLAGVSLSKDGQVAAFVADAPSHPGEAFLLPTDGEEPARLTRSNPWLEQMRLAKQEVITHTAADSLELQGILIRPMDETPGQRYPLILAVHGGPESHVHNGWVTSYANPGQVAAAAGMAVFYPNYRGSTGRGVAFSKLGQHDSAGKEFSDLIDAIDHLERGGLVDRRKVGITGGSYGGYASAWGATYYTEHFAASVMFVGISDNVSKLGTTDIPDEMFLVHHRKRLWDDWNYFIERSPIRHVEKARTPLLILHGKDDPRVHPSQSLELHRHFKTLGQAPVRLVLYPGEGHGNRRAASRLDYNLRLLQWMKHYLQGPGGPPPPLELDYGLATDPDKTPASPGEGRPVEASKAAR